MGELRSTPHIPAACWPWNNPACRYDGRSLTLRDPTNPPCPARDLETTPPHSVFFGIFRWKIRLISSGGSPDVYTGAYQGLRLCVMAKVPGPTGSNFWTVLHRCGVTARRVDIAYIGTPCEESPQELAGRKWQTIIPSVA